MVHSRHCVTESRQRKCNCLWLCANNRETMAVSAETAVVFRLLYSGSVMNSVARGLSGDDGPTARQQCSLIRVLIRPALLWLPLVLLSPLWMLRRWDLVTVSVKWIPLDTTFNVRCATVAFVCPSSHRPKTCMFRGTGGTTLQLTGICPNSRPSLTPKAAEISSSSLRPMKAVSRMLVI